MNDAAKQSVLMLAFVGCIIAQTNCDFETAKLCVARLCALTEVALNKEPL